VDLVDIGATLLLNWGFGKCGKKGEWRMEKGEWRRENGEGRMEKGEWRREKNNVIMC